MTRSAWPPCTKHDGAHRSIWGQCVHWGAPFALRPGVCPEPGCSQPIMRRLEIASGQVDVIEDGSDRPHRHQPPLTVRIDEDALAGAIVSAARASREERRPAPTPSQPAMAPISAPSRPLADTDGLLTGVSVWTSEDTGGGDGGS